MSSLGLVDWVVCLVYLGVVFALAVGGITDGWSGLWKVGAENGRWSLVHLKGGLLSRENFTSPSSVYTAVAFFLFMYLPGYAVSQNMMQRYVGTGGLREARGVVTLSALINTALGFLFLLVGVAIFAYYAGPGGSGMPGLVREDQILPYFVSQRGVVAA